MPSTGMSITHQFIEIHLISKLDGIHSVERSGRIRCSPRVLGTDLVVHA